MAILGPPGSTHPVGAVPETSRALRLVHRFMNPHLSALQTYPFEKLAQLKRGVVPPAELSAITMAIGDPQQSYN